MTSSAAQDRKEVWSLIFKRKGGDGVYTRLFDEIDSARRAKLLSLARLPDDEIPVVASFADTNSWLLLTTERLIWSSTGARQELALTIVREVRPDFEALRRSKIPKTDMKDLQIRTFQNEELIIELEPGAPLFGVWNILNNVAHRNRNAQRGRRGEGEA
jgi:hypothetical protein